MPLTYTGRLVKPGGVEYPSLRDIAVSLSRQPRFAGHCRRWWSVLDHTLFCDELLKAGGVLVGRGTRLAVLLHDAHEAITADVPTDFKDDALKQRQKSLDVAILDGFFPGGYEAHFDCDYGYRVKGIDRRALCAEARVVGPPATPERILELFGVCEETVEDVALLDNLLRFPHDYMFGAPPLQSRQQDHPGVMEFIARVVDLL